MYLPTFYCGGVAVIGEPRYLVEEAVDSLDGEEFGEVLFIEYGARPQLVYRHHTELINGKSTRIRLWRTPTTVYHDDRCEIRVDQTTIHAANLEEGLKAVNQLCS